LQPSIFDFVAGGSGDEQTMASNLRGFDRFKLRPRILRDVSSVDTRIDFFGADLAAPIFVSPMGQQKLIHRSGEKATAQGAGRAGLGFVLSMGASVSLEEVAKAGCNALWLQMYYLRDRQLMADLVARAVQAGFRAICLTADVPVVGFRRRDQRHKQLGNSPADFVFGNFEKYYKERSASTDAYLLSGLHDLAVTWSDLEWLRSQSELPLALKGVMTREDARCAVDSGVQVIVVSNHGGRQIDHASGAIDVLQEVVEAVDGRAKVVLDGGVRRPTDIAIALSLGADAVMVGRPVLWALALAGADGVAELLKHLTGELGRVLTLMGIARVADLDASNVETVNR
jgi:4-hydroxymandelate oxidase